MCNSCELISIIIPVYNAEKWLRECIESVINQTYRNIEIILVDDGSTDKSARICWEYANCDKRIKVIQKENTGVSDSRNVAIDNAKGEYLVFLDADDSMDCKILEYALATMKMEDSQLCIWDTSFVKVNQVINDAPVYGNLFSREEIISTVISGYNDNYYLGHYFRAVWAKLLKKNIIVNNKIRFCSELYIGEDALFLIEYLMHVEKLSVVSHIGNYYRIHSLSAVRRYKEDLYEQSIMQMEKIIQCLEVNKILDDNRIKTSITILSWEIFRRLVKNRIQGGYQGVTLIKDAFQWYKRYEKQLEMRGIIVEMMPKISKIEYGMSRFIPAIIQCIGAIIYERYNVRKMNDIK